jgi:neutral trehalase
MCIRACFADCSGLYEWVPSDWKVSPRILSKIPDDRIQAWATDMNIMLRRLGRFVGDEVRLNPERHSLLHVKYPFIVSGDTYREAYYWYGSCTFSQSLSLSLSCRNDN